MGSFLQLPIFLAEFWSLNCSKKSIFCSFVLTFARNLSLLKQFTYVHLKVLITLFQNMIQFIGAEPLLMRYQRPKYQKMMTQQIFNKILLAIIEKITVLFDQCNFLHILTSEVLKYTLFYEQTMLDSKNVFIVFKKTIFL